MCEGTTQIPLCTNMFMFIYSMLQTLQILLEKLKNTAPAKSECLTFARGISKCSLNWYHASITYSFEILFFSQSLG